MKTPREILLARHRATEPGLDAIRQAVVDDLTSQDMARSSRNQRSADIVVARASRPCVSTSVSTASETHGRDARATMSAGKSSQDPMILADRAKASSGTIRLASLCRRCLTVSWRELILPTRRIWTGLAAIWILILVINVSLRDNVSSVTGQPVRLPAVMMSWQAQQRWMNELFADRSTPPEADRPRNTAPKPRTEKYQMMPA